MPDVAVKDLCIDTAVPDVVARFWATMLGLEVRRREDGVHGPPRRRPECTRSSSAAFAVGRATPARPATVFSVSLVWAGMWPLRIWSRRASATASTSERVSIDSFIVAPAVGDRVSAAPPDTVYRSTPVI